MKLSTFTSRSLISTSVYTPKMSLTILLERYKNVPSSLLVLFQFHHLMEVKSESHINSVSRLITLSQVMELSQSLFRLSMEIWWQIKLLVLLKVSQELTVIVELQHLQGLTFIPMVLSFQLHQHTQSLSQVCKIPTSTHQTSFSL